MGWALLIVVLALLLGGVGLVVSALKWVLIIAAALFVVGLVTGWRIYSRV